MFRRVLAIAPWCLGLTFACIANVATANSAYYDSDCASCHGAAPASPRTCTGCHYHATHPASGTGVVDVTQFNLVATTDKTSYTTGETITVRLTGGNKSEESWTRLRLYAVNGTALNTTCTPRCSFTYALTTRAVAGMTRLRVGWYGNESREHANAVYASNSGGTTIDSTTQSNHTEEIVPTNLFTVTDAAPTGNTGGATGGGGGGSFDVFVLLAALFGAGRARRR